MTSQTMVEAIDKMLEDKLSAEISEFADDRQKLAEARAKVCGSDA